MNKKAIEILEEVFCCEEQHIIFNLHNRISLQDIKQALAELRAEPIDKRELYQKITEILVQSQFRYWVDSEPQTAQEMKSQTDRASQYYLGQSDIHKLTSPDSVRFHHIIKLQVGMIMKIVCDIIDR